MINRIPEMSQKAWEGSKYLNWILPGIGLLISLILLWYLWRYLRKSNKAGRMSEFDERTFKKLLEEEGVDDQQLPFCSDCKLPMRVEIHYKGFMKDQGEFLIQKKTAKQTLKTLVECERISKEDEKNILAFFAKSHTVDQQQFKRYKCPNCSKVQVLPYKTTIQTTDDFDEK